MSHAAASPFAALLGAAFATLPRPLQRLHRIGQHGFEGQVEVVRGNGLLSRLCAWTARLPPACTGPIRVEIHAAPGQEHWSRIVKGHAMRSRLWVREGALFERLGPLTFRFDLAARNEGITWRVTGAWLLGLPLPARYFSGVAAAESAEGARYRFDVRAALPLIGLLVHYRGWLDVD